MSVLSIPAAAAGGALQLISAQRLGSDGTITFAGIPQSFKDLVFSFDVRSVYGGVDNLQFQCGHGSVDTGANYGYAINYNGNSSGNAFNSADVRALAAIIHGDNETANYFSGGTIDLIDYTNPATMKGYLVMAGYYGIVTDSYYSWGGGDWLNVSQSIDIVKFSTYSGTGGNLKAGSSISMWGRV